MITAKQMIEAIRRAVAERGPDFVYPEEWKVHNDCQYRNSDGAPSCIVGLAVSYIDPTLQLEEGVAAEDALLNIATKAARSIAHTAQMDQDSRAPWGYALLNAERIYARYPEEPQA